MMRKLTLTVISLTILTFIFSLSFSTTETIDESFPTLDLARQSGRIHDGGYIPPIIPPSATEIRWRYNIDTNQVFLSFRFGEADLQSLLVQFSPIHPAIMPPLKQLPTWWPKSEIVDSSVFLGTEQMAETLQHIREFKTQTGSAKIWTGYLLLDKSQLQAFYFEVGSSEQIGTVLDQPIYRAAFSGKASSHELAAELRHTFLIPISKYYQQQLSSEITPTPKEIEQATRCLSDKGTQRPKAVARFLLNGWKFQRHLYKHFGGGRIIFQQAGLEAFDATHRWIKEHEQNGRFRILDPELRELFYRYWTRDTHTFLDETSDALQRFLDPDWICKDS